ncbi:macrophage mannose receptor 1-like [Elysia marginata]|uniref:Macrophage mannose receptor 1-like n=1 Tax=Elysia marginata TaxID=1093978 RepID=A0AAV4FK49_9GAST|nr:macrophage mannose receptor 1-like [Elysia marginata]
MSNQAILVFLCISIMASMRPIYCHDAVYMSAMLDPNCCDSYDVHAISCITDVKLSSMENATSLTVYASQGDVGNDEFERMAAVELGNPDPLLFDSSEQYDASGKIGTGKDSISQLAFSWKSSVVREVKRYKCEVKGVGTSGREMTISVTAEAPSKELTVDTDDENTVKENQDVVANVTQAVVVNNVDNPDSDTIVVVPAECSPDKVNVDHLNASTNTILYGVANSTAELEGNILNVDTSIETLKQKVNTLEELANNRTNILADLRDQMSSFIETYKSTYLVSNFDMLGLYRGNKYYVTNTDATFDISAAASQCSRLEGYLLEIDDQAEFDFMVKQLAKVDGDLYFTGGNDIEQKGVWKFKHDNRLVEFINWSPSAVGSSEKHCRAMKRSFSLKFDQVSCSAIGKYICESPM